MARHAGHPWAYNWTDLDGFQVTVVNHRICQATGLRFQVHFPCPIAGALDACDGCFVLRRVARHSRIRMAKVKTATAATSAKPSSASDWCRGCWRSRQVPLQHLPCGDSLCNECIAARARASIQAPAQMLPLRCCQQPVPSAVIASALLPAELAFYQLLVAQNVERLQKFITESRTNSLTATCDFCRSALFLRTSADALKLLTCGHIYCDDCSRALRESAAVTDKSAPICCSDLPPLTTSASTPPAAASATKTEDPRITARRRTSSRLATGKGKSSDVDSVKAEPATGKRKATETETPAEAKRSRTSDDAAVDLPLSVDCTACMAHMADESTQMRGPCGHAYCTTCVKAMAEVSLKDRSRIPIRCCGKEFPINYIQRVLAKRKLAQYERFVTERDWRGSDLKSDVEYAQLVTKLKGKQCPTCGIGIQKVRGCQTMSCPHGHYFCWRCMQITCTCK